MMRRCLGVVAPLLLLLAACGQDEGVSLSPVGGAVSDEYWFDSLPVMVATSDVVVLGTVIELKQGTTVGPPGYEIELLDAILAVQEVLYGSAGESSTLAIQTDPFIPAEPEWRETGITVLAFMDVNTDPGSEGKYYLVNSQSLYVVAGTDVQPAVEGDPLSEQMAAMTIDEIRSKILKATEAIAAGEVNPQTPVGG